MLHRRPFAAFAVVLLIVALAPIGTAAQQLVSAAPAASVAAMPTGGSDAFRRPAPTALRQDDWVALDKAKHVGGSLLLTLSTQYVLVVKADWSERDALPASITSAAVIGVSKELYDRYASPTGVFSTKDLVADALGIALGVIVILV